MKRVLLLSAALAACSLPFGAESEDAGTLLPRAPRMQAAIHMLSRDRELRYWSEPSNPEARRGAVLLAFKRAHPCPANGVRVGPCPGWVMDHVIPLACGGGDAVINLQWLPVAMWREKSKWERKIYRRQGDKPTAYCR